MSLVGFASSAVLSIGHGAVPGGFPHEPLEPWVAWSVYAGALTACCAILWLLNGVSRRARRTTEAAPSHLDEAA